MDVIDFELRRYDTMRNELDVRKQPSSSTPSENAGKDMLNRSTEDSLDIMKEEKPIDVSNQYCLILSQVYMLLF